MAIVRTADKINKQLGTDTSHMTTGKRGMKTKKTEATVKEILKHGTPDWFTHPEDYKDMAKEEYARAKETSDGQVSGFRMPDQAALTDEARKSGVLTLAALQDRLKKNGLYVWSVESPRHDGTGGLWALVPTTAGKKPLFVTTVQYPCMYEWSTLREDEHGLPNGEEFIGWRNVCAKLIELNIWSEDKVNKVFGTPPIALHTARYRRTLWNLRNNRPAAA
jgi:hypothetical protein